MRQKGSIKKRQTFLLYLYSLYLEGSAPHKKWCCFCGLPPHDNLKPLPSSLCSSIYKCNTSLLLFPVPPGKTLCQAIHVPPSQINFPLLRVPQMGSTDGGTIWVKWPKPAWKLQNQHFWVKTVAENMGGQVNFLSSGGISPVPPNGGNPASSLKHQQTSFKLYLLQESNPQLAKSKWALSIYTQSKIERAFVSFFLLKTFCLMKELPEGYIHEIKYQENCKYLLIFLKRNKIQRVTRSHFTAFSKWAKVECYIDLMVTVPLLFKDSLKSQTWLFSYRSFAGPSMIFKFSLSEQI